jgi:hypothetical protein
MLANTRPGTLAEIQHIPVHHSRVAVNPPIWVKLRSVFAKDGLVIVYDGRIH